MLQVWNICCFLGWIDGFQMDLLVWFGLVWLCFLVLCSFRIDESAHSCWICRGPNSSVSSKEMISDFTGKAGPLQSSSIVWVATNSTVQMTSELDSCVAWGDQFFASQRNSPGTGRLKAREVIRLNHFYLSLCQARLALVLGCSDLCGGSSLKNLVEN